MTSEQIRQLDQRLFEWRAQYADAESVRAAHRQQALKFALTGMAMMPPPIMKPARQR